MIRILIVDDEKPICDLIDLNLSSAGYHCTAVQDGLEAIDLIEQEPFDLVLLDIMLPGADGYDVMEYIRPLGIPVIFITAKYEVKNRVKGLKLGADDYLVKPFNPLELVARINAQFRRFHHLGNVNSASGDDGKITLGDLTLDTHQLTLEKNGTPIALTATEYKILVMLMKSPGRVFTKMQIYEEVNGDYYANDDNTMMVHISNLRDKIEEDPKNPQYIKTVRGLGYKIERI